MSFDNACPICQETLHGANSVGCTVPCGHLFHRKCFETWQMHSPSAKCPCCMLTLSGFIDKIHITLPTINSNAMEDPTISFQRRKMLTREKGKRSAMMRHTDRRRRRSDSGLHSTPATSCSSHDFTAESRDDSPPVAATLPNMSLSASLQRVPRDPIKQSKMANMASSLDHLRDHSRNVMMYNSTTLSDIDDLSGEIPDVAASIMRNIEESIRQITPRRYPKHHHQSKQVPAGGNAPIQMTPGVVHNNKR